MNATVMPEPNATAKLALAGANCIEHILEVYSHHQPFDQAELRLSPDAKKTALRIAGELRELARAQAPAPSISDVVDDATGFRRFVEALAATPCLFGDKGGDDCLTCKARRISAGQQP